MELQTYAKLMDKTESFPLTQFLSKGYSPKSEGSKKERVNKLARELFLREFLKKYGGEKIVFENNSGKNLSLKLENIKFNTNHTNYDLIFTPNERQDFSHFWIKNGNYIDSLNEEKIKDKLGQNYQLNEKSKDLIRKLWRY